MMFSNSAELARNRAMPYIRMKGYEASQVKGQFIVKLRPDFWNRPNPPKPEYEIFVRNLDECMLEDELFPIFEGLGGLYEFRLMLRFSGHNRGMAFALYSNETTFRNALSKLHHRQLGNNCILEATGSYNKRYITINSVPIRLGLSTIGNLIYSKTFNVVEIRAIQNGDTFNVAIKYQTHLCAAMARKILACELKEKMKHLTAEWLNPQHEHLINTYNILINKSEEGAMIVTETFPVPEMKDAEDDRRERKANCRAITGKKHVDYRNRNDAAKNPIKENYQNFKPNESYDKIPRNNHMDEFNFRNFEKLAIDENNNAHLMNRLYFDRQKFIDSLEGEERKLFAEYFRKNSIILHDIDNNSNGSDEANKSKKCDESEWNAKQETVVKPYAPQKSIPSPIPMSYPVNNLDNQSSLVSLLNPNATPFSKYAFPACEASQNGKYNFEYQNKKTEKEHNLLLNTLLNYNEADSKFAYEKNTQPNVNTIPILPKNGLINNYESYWNIPLMSSYKNYEKPDNGLQNSIVNSINATGKEEMVQNNLLNNKNENFKIQYESHQLFNTIQAHSKNEQLTSQNEVGNNSRLFDTNLEANGKTPNGNYNLTEQKKEEPNNLLMNSLLNFNQKDVHYDEEMVTEVKPFTKGLIKNHEFNGTTQTAYLNSKNNFENENITKENNFNWILSNSGEEIKQHYEKK